MAFVSDVFSNFLPKEEPQKRHGAIIVYRTPESATARRLSEKLRGRLDRRNRKQYLAEAAQLYEGPRESVLGRGILGDSLAAARSSIGRSGLPFDYIRVTRETLNKLEQSDHVVTVLPNQSVKLIGPAGTSRSEPTKSELNTGMTWGIEHLDIPKVWEQAGKGAGVTVAVLDTGVCGQHSALRRKVKGFVVVDPRGRRVNSPRFDASEHGTHVCGTIVGGADPNGVRIGVAPDAHLLVGAVLIGNATLRTIIAGIDWAVQNDADIINMSLGFTYYEPLFDSVLQTIRDVYGILPVAAIGNERYGNSSSPGNVRTSLGVGATVKPAKETVVADFSSGASLEFPGTDDRVIVTKPDVTAPGVNIYSCVPAGQTTSGMSEYGCMNGTSMAAPHVAGVAALLMGAKPGAGVVNVAEALRETAWHPDGDDKRPDNRWGWGEICPLDALDAL